MHSVLNENSVQKQLIIKTKVPGTQKLVLNGFKLSLQQIQKPNLVLILPAYLYLTAFFQINWRLLSFLPLSNAYKHMQNSYFRKKQLNIRSISQYN